MDSNSMQTINFKGSETEYSAEIVAQDVTISCSDGNHNKGSSKVKLKNVVDYNWEFKNYIGQLVACHVSGVFYAYTVKPKGKMGMIRVVNLETDERVLVKNFSGTIEDISFAFTRQIIFACTDNMCNLYVYSVDALNGGTLVCNSLMHVKHPKATSANYRVIWCPYVPSFDEDSDTVDDPAKLLVFMNGTKAEVWDVSIVSLRYGQRDLEPVEDMEGYVEIAGHSRDIIDACFAPDGTAIATASLDGYVKFFQVYHNDSDSPRCLHQWQPHDGKPLSCLLFLDSINLYERSDVRFWKFAITGANNNAEIKIWSCESWTCLQTIRFEPNVKSSIPNLSLKIVLDLSADYLLLSDINNQIMYVLQIKKNEEERTAVFSTISEFLQPASILSFGIVRLSSTSHRFPSNEELYEDMEEFEDDTANRSVSIRMIIVQPKSLQDCTITFKPEGSMASNVKSVYGNVAQEADSNGEKSSSEELPKLGDLQTSVTLLIQQQNSQPLTLMTPDDFNSPIVNASPTARNSIELPTPAAKKDHPALENFPIAHASTGSSPSREVEEILNRSAYDLRELMFNNAEKLTPDMTWMMAKKAEKRTDALNKKDESYLQWLALPLVNIESMLKEQAKQIQELQMQSYKKKDDDNDVSTVMRKEIDAAIAVHHLQITKMLDGFLKEQKRKDNENLDYLLSNLSQHLGKQVQDNLQKIVCYEIQENILPPVMKIFNSFENQLELHLSKELNTIDQLLKSNITKLFSTKQVADSLSNSIVHVVKPSLESCYKDMVHTELIPSWERVCNTMFQQVHGTFTQGTKEYTTCVESYMDRQRKVQDNGKDLVNQIHIVSESLKSNSEKMSNMVQEEIKRQFGSLLVGVQEKMSVTLAEVVKENVRQGFRTHSAHLEDSVVNAVRSRAVTPSPQVIDTQMQMSQLQSLIIKGNINAAFQQALSSSASVGDLSLVLFVCENISPEEVFRGNKCLLQQPVLLSLVQQLSADLMHKTDVKHKYLQEAILNLDVNNSGTREHVPNVLNELSKQLKNFILTNPHNKHLMEMRMLLMATKSLVN